MNITLDGKNINELLQINAFLSSQDGNDAALDELHDYIEANARRLYEQAVADGDIENGAFLEDVLEYADPEFYEQLLEEAATEEEAANERNAAADAVAIWFEDNRQEEETQLRNEAANVKADPHNLFKAGTFEGMARMLAATITGCGADRGASINELEMAIYERYGIAW